MITKYCVEDLKAELGLTKVFVKSRGDGYVDGSCKWPQHRHSARAGWSVVQIDDEGKVVAAGQGTVVGRQTAAEGEQVGLEGGDESARFATVIPPLYNCFDRAPCQAPY